MSIGINDALSKLYLKIGGKPEGIKENKSITDFLDDLGNVLETYLAPMETDPLRIQALTRANKHREYFPVGTLINVPKIMDGISYPLTFRVVDHDKFLPDGVEHSTVLELAHAYSDENGDGVDIEFDELEAIYYASEELPAGTYNFRWVTKSGKKTSGYYYFTTTKTIPKGGQIFIVDNSKAWTASILFTQSNINNDILEENIAVLSGQEGTFLGEIDLNSSNKDNLNIGVRIINGSNNYYQSSIRQWLNSDGKVRKTETADENLWIRHTIFDRSPYYITYIPSEWNFYDRYHVRKVNGFMCGIDPRFLSVVCNAKIPCNTNDLFEVNSIDGTTFSPSQNYYCNDKFFLLSSTELYNDYIPGRADEVLEYYKNKPASEKIHRDVNGAVAKGTWLRSPGYKKEVSSYSIPQGCTYIRTDGTCANFTVNGLNYISPACIIA